VHGVKLAAGQPARCDPRGARTMPETGPPALYRQPAATVTCAMRWVTDFDPVAQTKPN
jgi:hypothetical protein